MNKLFIIGLPRTGTTSISLALLDQGFKVAHTAYTKATFSQAEVFSDTPCYSDYAQLDALFPGSKFVYLERNIESWIPSIQMLLQKMQVNLSPQGHFNPIIKRCFHSTFGLLETDKPLSLDHLARCYLKHQKQVNDFFQHRQDLLKLNVAAPDGLTQLLKFIGQQHRCNMSFPKINTGQSVNAWRNIKHPNKINSSASGPERRKFFDYA